MQINIYNKAVRNKYVFGTSWWTEIQTSSGVVLQDFIVFTLLSSQNTLDIFTVQMLLMNRASLRGVNLPQKYAYSQSCPVWGDRLSRPR